MNYFLEVNKEQLQNLSYEIDSSPALLKDMLQFWNKRVNDAAFKQSNIPTLSINNNGITEVLNGVCLNLTCDYLGPSRYCAEKRRWNLATILAYYIPSRVFGGHMIWPSKEFQVKEDGIKKSINTAVSYCFKERRDYSLFAVKQWYNNSSQQNPVFKKVLDGNECWLKQFGCFNGFIDFFMLNAFVNPKYEVYDLSSFTHGEYRTIISVFPIVAFTGKDEYLDNLIAAYIPEDYSGYVKGCVEAIWRRNTAIQAI